MGGSGGSYFSKDDADGVIKQMRRAEEQTYNAEFESKVNGVIGEILSEYNDRDRDQTKQYLESIKKALEKEIDGTVDLLFAGSVSRHTYVDGLSDIDSLVILDNCDLADGSPEKARSYIAQRLTERFPNTPIKEGDLAVTISFNKMQIQVVPAVRCDNDLTISNSTGKRWSKVNPKRFAELLTKVNESNGGKLVPMIKIAKGINSKLPENQRLKSYHIESLAIKIFRDYPGKQTTKQMLKHFFAEASLHVLAPIKDRTGQTVHTDDYLGSFESGDRLLRSNALRRINRRMKNADISNSIAEWTDIIS